MPARAPRPSRRAGAGVLAALAVGAAGCGSASVAELPPAAAPRAAPVAAEAPAGRVLPRASVPAEVARALDAPFGAVTLDDGRRAEVRPRAREVALSTPGGGAPEVAGAGVGPTAAAAHDRWLWVTDTQGDALLVFRTAPELELVRRVHLPGGPYAIAFDAARFRIWVTLSGANEVVELPSHGRPRVLERFATVQGPRTVAVDPATDAVRVAGSGGDVQVLDLPPAA